MGEVWPELVVGRWGRGCHEEVGTDDRVSQTVRGNIELKCSAQTIGQSPSRRSSSPVERQFEAPPAKRLMSELKLLISIDVECPFELTESTDLLSVLLRNFLLHIAEFEGFDLPEGSKDCSTDTSCQYTQELREGLSGDIGSVPGTPPPPS